MKLIVNKSNGIIVEALDGVDNDDWTDTGLLIYNGEVVASVNPDEVEIVDYDTLPDDWLPQKYVYDSDTGTISVRSDVPSTFWDLNEGPD